MNYLFTRAIGVAALAVLFAGTSAAAPDVKDTIKKSFEVSSGGRLYVDLDHGTVEVRAGGGSGVSVEVEREVDVDSKTDAKRILEDHELEFSQDGDDVTIRSRYDGDGGLWSGWKDRARMSIKVLVRVPENYDVDFATGAGNVTVRDISGDVDGTTGAGNITIGQVDGSVEIRSGSGNIEIAGVSGELEVKSGAGNISVGYVRGQVSAHTGAGNISAKITQQPQSDSELETGAGNITVYIAQDVRCDVDAVAVLGSASTDFDLNVEGKWMKKSFAGAVNGGGPDLRLRSGVGNVELKRL
jgi:hypothetical protein